MSVKSVTLLLIMVALVAGSAVSASQASPVATSSIALQRCLVTEGTVSSYLCQPISRVVDERIDGDYLGDSVGGDSVDPEKKWAQLLHFIAVAAEAAANLLDNLTYGPQVDPAGALIWVDELFDTSVQ